MKQQLAGKVVVVTGASSGIGAATARAFADRGARVILAGRRTAELDAQVGCITSVGGAAKAITTDVTDPAQVVRLMERACRAYGPVDVLVNNAGVSCAQPFSGTGEDQIGHVLRANLVGTMLATRAVLPQMLAEGRGAIISVGSVSSRVAVEPLYAATKFGVRGFSLALRRQLAGTPISVSLVTAGNSQSKPTEGPPGRAPEPDLVADAIVHLAARPRREVIIPSRYCALVLLEEVWPSLADWFFNLRRRRASGEGETLLPAYAYADRLVKQSMALEPSGLHERERTP